LQIFRDNCPKEEKDEGLAYPYLNYVLKKLFCSGLTVPKKGVSLPFLGPWKFRE
jgi:hypothetical protein